MSPFGRRRSRDAVTDSQDDVLESAPPSESSYAGSSYGGGGGGGSRVSYADLADPEDEEEDPDAFFAKLDTELAPRGVRSHGGADYGGSSHGGDDDGGALDELRAHAAGGPASPSGMRPLLEGMGDEGAAFTMEAPAAEDQRDGAGMPSPSLSLAAVERQGQWSPPLAQVCPSLITYHARVLHRVCRGSAQFPPRAYLCNRFFLPFLGWKKVHLPHARLDPL